MKTRLSLIVASLLFLSSLGCAKSPTARWAQARDVLTQTQDGILIGHRAGLVSDQDLIVLDQYVKAARSALKQAEAQLPDGGSTFEFYLGLVEDTLDRLARARKKEISYGTGSHSRIDRSGEEPRRIRIATGGAGPAGWGVYARAA